MKIKNLFIKSDRWPSFNARIFRNRRRSSNLLCCIIFHFRVRFAKKYYLVYFHGNLKIFRKKYSFFLIPDD